MTSLVLALIFGPPLLAGGLTAWRRATGRLTPDRPAVSGGPLAVMDSLLRPAKGYESGRQRTTG